MLEVAKAHCSLNSMAVIFAGTFYKYTNCRVMHLLLFSSSLKQYFMPYIRKMHKYSTICTRTRKCKRCSTEWNIFVWLIAITFMYKFKKFCIKHWSDVVSKIVMGLIKTTYRNLYAGWACQALFSTSIWNIWNSENIFYKINHSTLHLPHFSLSLLGSLSFSLNVP